mmetsp:Transcript_15621/g.18151  ORF Transcript_15621/g.18151 Transcript_15621/m.18151 type:complete len:434 (-) Transcript_15621:111-1412(-)
MLDDSSLKTIVEDKIAEKCNGSVIFAVDNDVLCIDPYALEEGDLLGKGTFCNVFEVKSIITTDACEFTSSICATTTRNILTNYSGNDHSESSDENQIDEYTNENQVQRTSRNEELSYLMRHCERSSGHTQFALKKFNSEIATSSRRNSLLRRSSEETIQEVIAGITDLAMEAKFLANIQQHPHIIRIRAVSDIPYGRQFFIVLDKIIETLEQRIDSWKKPSFNLKGSEPSCITKMWDFTNRRRDIALANRLDIARKICSALGHIHSHNCIYRDLKPDNIGFNYNGTLKLFDLGLVREMRKIDRVQGKDTYNLSKRPGNLRYSSPELAKGGPYNHKTDIYSFGILLWAICTLQKPFEGYRDERKFFQDIICNDTRPQVYLPERWPEKLSQLMVKSWSSVPEDRPSTCLDIVKILDVLIPSLQRVRPKFRNCDIT